MGQPKKTADAKKAPKGKVIPLRSDGEAKIRRTKERKAARGAAQHEREVFNKAAAKAGPYMTPWERAQLRRQHARKGLEPQPRTGLGNIMVREGERIIIKPGSAQGRKYAIAVRALGREEAAAAEKAKASGGKPKKTKRAANK